MTELSATSAVAFPALQCWPQSANFASLFTNLQVVVAAYFLVLQLCTRYGRRWTALGRG